MGKRISLFKFELLKTIKKNKVKNDPTIKVINANTLDELISIRNSIKFM